MNTKERRAMQNEGTELNMANKEQRYRKSSVSRALTKFQQSARLSHLGAGRSVTRLELWENCIGECLERSLGRRTSEEDDGITGGRKPGRCYRSMILRGSVSPCSKWSDANKEGEHGDVGKKHVTNNLWKAERSGPSGIVKLPAKHYGLFDFEYEVPTYDKGRACEVPAAKWLQQASIRILQV